MTKDRVLTLLQGYEKIEIVINVYNAAITKDNFFGLPTTAQECPNTSFEVLVNGGEFMEYYTAQERSYNYSISIINAELLKISNINVARLKVNNWTQTLQRCLTKINKPIDKSSIIVQFNVVDYPEPIEYDGNESTLKKYFLECQELLSKVILVPLKGYLRIIENILTSHNDINSVIEILEGFNTKSKKLRTLFDMSKLSELNAKQFFGFLRDEVKAIHPETTEESFLALCGYRPFVQKIDWIGSRGSFKTFITFLKEAELMPPQPWSLIIESFFLPMHPEYLTTTKVSSGSFKTDNSLKEKLDSFYKKQLY